jgi:undecaprenyl-diphosphatase
MFLGCGRRWSAWVVLATLLVLGTSAVAWTQHEAATAAVAKAHARQMTATQAVVLGLVEGITEYLPVSSTGHLLVAQHFLGIGSTPDEKTAADAYAICIQFGAILAVLGLYFAHVRRMVAGLFGRDRVGLRMAINVIIGFLPAAVIGLLLKDTIKHYLFGMWPIIFAWFVGGVIILLIARKQHAASQQGASLEEMSPKQALGIGFIQCIAMWPGVSRSLATIVGGALLGLSITAAVEFSFLLGLVTLSAATLLDAAEEGRRMLAMFGPVMPFIGLAVAWLSAVVSVKWMVGYLQKHGLAIFGYYRVAVAVVVLALLLLGWVKA